MISVIVPAHNEAAYLPATLAALKQQNHSNYEVIVVANGCSDSTADVARGNCDRLVVLSDKNLGVSRNLGARMAQGDILLFLDADTTLEPMALRRISQCFSRKHAAGTLMGRPDREGLKYRVVYLLKNWIHRLSLHGGSSGVIMCWKKHFFEIGGFDEQLEVRENSHLIKRLLSYGRYCYIGDVAATTSMRRYQHCGVQRVVWLWLKLWFQSLFGDLRKHRYETVR
jgi:glycosyltransferase involved in cell wall biosynthesis